MASDDGQGLPVRPDMTMATVACRCCGASISADTLYCLECKDHAPFPQAVYYISYPRTEYEERKARELGCPHVNATG